MPPPASRRRRRQERTNGFDAFMYKIYEKITSYLPSPNVLPVSPHFMCLLRFFVGALAAQYSISQLLSSGAPEVLFYKKNPHFYFTSSAFAFLLPTAYAEGFASNSKITTTCLGPCGKT